MRPASTTRPHLLTVHLANHQAWLVYCWTTASGFLLRATEGHVYSHQGLSSEWVVRCWALTHVATTAYLRSALSKLSNSWLLYLYTQGFLTLTTLYHYRFIEYYWVKGWPLAGFGFTTMLVRRHFSFCCNYNMKTCCGSPGLVVLACPSKSVISSYFVLLLLVTISFCMINEVHAFW